jgi:ribosomal-protein-alanine N-acetyltransferase
MVPSLVWRPMREEDVERIAALEACIHAAPWTAGNFRDSLAAGYSCVIGEVDCVIAVYGVLVMGAGEGQILNVSVVPGQRRRGFATALLQRFVTLSEDCGAEQLFLEVRVSNAPAIALYNAAGFREVARRRSYYPPSAGKQGREDALVMRLGLSAQQRMAAGAR